VRLFACQNNEPRRAEAAELNSAAMPQGGVLMHLLCSARHVMPVGFDGAHDAPFGLV